MYFLNNCSKHFITSDVSAIGWKLFNPEGLETLATGIMVL